MIVEPEKNFDAALNLRVRYDNGENIPTNEATELLNKSDLIKKITGEFEDKPLYYIWRIIALSEIPYAETLNYTQELIRKIYDKLTTPFGFSLSGDEKMFLPCYNAMLASALCRLGRYEEKEVRNAIEWINDYQPMERGVEISLPNLKFDRYGGCFKATPCFISIAKSTKALYEYEKASGDSRFAKKKNQGIEYILRHHLFKRLSNGKPITRNILALSFPETYHLNIMELIRLISDSGNLKDERCSDAINFIKSKKKNGAWKTNFRYKSAGYTAFDNNWLTYIIEKSLTKI